MINCTFWTIFELFFKVIALAEFCIYSFSDAGVFADHRAIGTCTCQAGIIKVGGRLALLSNKKSVTYGQAPNIIFNI